MRTKDNRARDRSGPRNAEAMRRVEPQGIGRDDLRALGLGNGIGVAQADGLLKVLEELEQQGELQLPPKKNKKKPSTERVHGAKHTKRTMPPDDALVGKLACVSPVRLEIVEGRDQVKLWNEYLDRHHYLGYRKPFGCTIRYFIVCDKGRLGCVLVAGASRALKARDEWIGWSHRCVNRICRG